MHSRPIAGILLSLVSVSFAQTPLGTAFADQRQLKSGGSPASGSFNIAFKLRVSPGEGIDR